MSAAVKVYVLAVSGLIVGLIAQTWAVHPETQANSLHEKNCWLWYSMNQKNYQVTMERLTLRLGEENVK